MEDTFLNNDKMFYIVPGTKSYYDTVMAGSKEDALVTFATNMTDDMSAYFKAVDKEPVHYPHEYKYPDGKFQLAMSIIVATITGNTKSQYFVNGGLKDVNLSDENLKIIAKLQETYDIFGEVDKAGRYKYRKKFYNLLKEITGFAFDEEKEPDPEEKVRVHVRADSYDDMGKICKKLDKKQVPYDEDGGGRLIVERAYLKQTLKTIDKLGLKADVI